ncbi:exosome component Rrp46 [Roridomyces roridus]|uniref:Exosome component Rrp46 n=1 Tax=Roridomyces roridus TaxID=1738132 RepID=A0AAD7CC18_9AGAR|nr:exosome component Rrp46 [Roridomyces roridus]
MASTSRRTGRDSTQLRALQTSLDGLARVDGSARFGFGTTAALSSISGPIEVRLAAEHPSLAAFEVLLRPLSNVPTTQSKSLAATLRSALLPSLILTQNPRTLIQLVVQSLSKGTSDALVAAMLNSSTLALLNAGSIPMRSVVCAVAVGRKKSTSEFIVDPEEEEEPSLASHGCFAFSFANGDARCVWTNWRSGSAAVVFDEKELAEAKDVALDAAREVFMHIQKVCRAMEGDDESDEEDDDKMVVS